MPIYEYVCYECDAKEERLRTIAERNLTEFCDSGHAMERIVSVPAVSIWNPYRTFPNAVKSGDGRFPTRAAYETHLKMNDMAEAKTDGKNRSRIPRSMRG